MSFSSRAAFISAIGLLSTASALPSSASSSQDCAPGTWYSSCGDISGCFDHDPCSQAPTCAPGTTGNSTRAAMYVVAPSLPDTAYDAVDYFQVQAGQTEIDAVGVLGGIPAGAAACELWWRQGPAGARDFVVVGTGYVDVEQRGGLDAARPVTYAAVAAAQDLGHVGTAAMGNWDAPEVGAMAHKVGSVSCAEQVALLFSVFKDLPDISYNTYLELDDNNGWYVKYTC